MASCCRSRPWAWAGARARSRSSGVSEQLVIARHNGIAWVHAAHAVPQTSSASVYEQSLCAFRQLRALFASAGVRFDQVIRTWLYLGGIVDDEGPTQRYKELNRAATDFYAGHSLPGRPPAARRYTRPVYPASTGIGTEGRGIMHERHRPGHRPRGHRGRAAGEPPADGRLRLRRTITVPKSPKFSRAMALSCGNYATIFVSGTASITASETRHVGDAAAQTARNAGQHRRPDLRGEPLPARSAGPGHRPGRPGPGPRLHQAAGGLRPDRAVCEKRLGELPTIYAIGRRLPAGTAGGDRGNRVFAQGGGRSRSAGVSRSHGFTPCSVLTPGCRGGLAPLVAMPNSDTANRSRQNYVGEGVR